MCGFTRIDEITGSMVDGLLFLAGHRPATRRERHDGRDHLRLAHSGFRVACCTDWRRIARDGGEERAIEIMRRLISDEAQTVEGMSRVVKEEFGS